jgi:glycosyltransferase involved in cell wall biosynthesis
LVARENPLMNAMSQALGQGATAALRVLYLAKVYPYPPATAGDAVYSRGIIEALAQICTLCVHCADSGAPHQPHANIDWHIGLAPRHGRAGSVFSRWPLIAWTGATRDYHATLRGLLSQPWDAIVLDNLGLVHALPLVKHYRRTHPKTRLVYISHEHEYPTRAGKYGAYRLGPAKRFLAGLDLQKVRKTENAVLQVADIVTVINTKDLAPFREIAPGRKYLPFPPGYDGPVTATRCITAQTPRRILLLGGRKSEQKRQILLDWLAVSHDRLAGAGIETVIAGDMDDSLRQKIQARYPAAQVLGFVEDMTALIASARMGVVADTVGGGFKMRLLSHVFGRLPIVGLGDAIDGLPTPAGKGYAAADSLGALVDLVQKLVDDPDQLNRLQDRAFADCQPHYAWETRAEAFIAAIAGDSRGLV